MTGCKNKSVTSSWKLDVRGPNSRVRESKNGPYKKGLPV